MPDDLQWTRWAVRDDRVRTTEEMAHPVHGAVLGIDQRGVVFCDGGLRDPDEQLALGMNLRCYVQVLPHKMLAVSYTHLTLPTNLRV